MRTARETKAALGIPRPRAMILASSFSMKALIRELGKALS